jgi:peptidoglycan L-alanyl-D-glutamate endopeptidase CwlK
MRSKERQRELFAKGLSKTLNSRHLYGLAVDFAPLIDGEVTWKTPAFLPIIKAFKTASAELKIPIVSGGDWKTFKDYPHIELSRAVYK